MNPVEFGDIKYFVIPIIVSEDNYHAYIGRNVIAYGTTVTAQ